MISIKGLDKAKVLAALYNNAKPQGMGFLHYTPKPMDEEEAQEVLNSGQTYFDYVLGRVMKVDLQSDEEFDPRLYNRDNGAGSAERAIATLRKEEGESLTLREKQSRFARMVGFLLAYIYKQGYEATLGDAWAREGHIEGSFHYKRLAIDINLFRDGEYLTETWHHKPIGEFWERLGGTWGGRWGDGNHYSLGEGKEEEE